jgi:sulfopyruvate decarboxylase alpha subunit
MPAKKAWSDQVHAVLSAHQVRQIGYVPDGGLKHLITLARSDKRMRAVALTTEEEGIALATGAWLGGERCALLMQSSGVGNCINMLGMAIECRIPLLMIVTMRGQWGEFNTWQLPMAQGASTVLGAVGVIVQSVEQEADIAATVDAATRMAFNTNRVVAVQIAQRAIGTKAFK